jgi:murein tripeptide amidase MpaA
MAKKKKVTLTKIEIKSFLDEANRKYKLAKSAMKRVCRKEKQHGKIADVILIYLVLVATVVGVELNVVRTKAVIVQSIEEFCNFIEAL